ncbi:hypothetical protein [Shewanella sp.]|uniref:hypothetical protein n=1 Tax=Shewanella sp. TaxID=50422 RepID=UPI001B5D0468|nr:hypothetical protein [Shewanella sp.]MBP6518804.1 hypothetical protein [Shewanella sp.]
MGKNGSFDSFYEINRGFMNIILYRAKSHSGVWIYSLPVYLSANALGDGIQNESNLELMAIVPETLGAFINDYDMHHNRLFEGDHIRAYRPVYDQREGRSIRLVTKRNAMIPLCCASIVTG